MGKTVTVSEMPTKEICIKVGGVPVGFAAETEDWGVRAEALNREGKLNEVQCVEAKRLLEKLSLKKQAEKNERQAVFASHASPRQETSLRLV